MVSSGNGEKLGLRERKKLKTKQAIQRHALRLFRDQGYYETTVEQIADEAEVSPSTFFRYFPTKEAVVLEDDFDPVLVKAFKEQPPELSPLKAIRASVSHALSKVTDEEKEALIERMQLVSKVPELWAASLQSIYSTMRLISELVAERTGRGMDDFLVHSFAGAVVGVMVSLNSYYMENGDADFISLIEQGFANLESGFEM